VRFELRANTSTAIFLSPAQRLSLRFAAQEPAKAKPAGEKKGKPDQRKDKKEKEGEYLCL